MNERATLLVANIRSAMVFLLDVLTTHDTELAIIDKARHYVDGSTVPTVEDRKRLFTALHVVRKELLRVATPTVNPTVQTLEELQYWTAFEAPLLEEQRNIRAITRESDFTVSITWASCRAASAGEHWLRTQVEAL